MYQSNFSLVGSKKFNISELENMIPWERKVYIGMYLSELAQKRESIEIARRSAR